MTSQARVCDGCIKRKIKCDQKRPTCSRCRESDRTCSYSLTKRQPGPTRGLTQPRRTKRGIDLVDGSPETVPDSTSFGVKYGSHVVAAGVSSADTRQELSDSIREELHAAQDPVCCHKTQAASYESDLNVDDVTYMNALELSIDHLDVALPIFTRATVLSKTQASKFLRDTMVSIALTFPRVEDGCIETNARNYLDDQLRISGHTHPNERRLRCLEDFQLECLLAYYALHHYADHRGWSRIANLIREAYAVGLHQLDNPYSNLKFASVVDRADLESWRRLWWTLYVLDTCSNVAALTPFVVELESTRTAVVKGEDANHETIYLPTNYIDLPSVLEKLSQTRNADASTLSIMLHQLLRQCSNAFRFEIQNPSPPRDTRKRVSVLAQTTQDVTKAIPRGYTELMQMNFLGESTADHNRRLLNVLVLRLCTFFSASTLLLSVSEADVDNSWRDVLIACAEIASVFEHFDQNSFSTLDPAVCFAASCVLCFEEVFARIKVAGQVSSLCPEIANHRSILMNFLQSFSAYWNVAQFLLQAQRNFSLCVPAELNLHESRIVLRLYQGVLHQKWLSPPLAPPTERFDAAEDTNGAQHDPWFDLFNSVNWAELPDMTNSVVGHLVPPY